MAEPPEGTRVPIVVPETTVLGLTSRRYGFTVARPCRILTGLPLPKAVKVPLKFMEQGIRYADLSEEEKAEWDAK
ncbi:hypothetical protein, partial [Streptomyces sp. NPDC002690]